MNITFASTVFPVVALAAGSAIGFGFGMIQQFARRRYEQKERSGVFDNAWAVMPGSMTRVAYLMLALVLVQVTAPMLFGGVNQWLVSGGVVLGYGAMLFREFSRRRSQAV